MPWVAGNLLNCQPKINTIYKFVLSKNNKHDSIFRRGDNFVQIGNSYETSCVRLAAEVTGYLPLVIIYGNR